MLNKKSLERALEIRDIINNAPRGTGVSFSNEEMSFYKAQVAYSFELCSIAGMKLSSYDTYDEHILSIALFLIDTQRVKDWLTRLNNKAFW